MVYIKKIFLEGFKSFAKPTEIVFDKGLNVIVGPNGSGKSNIVDAVCFAFGSLGIKSMRAERASNLIFKGKNLEKEKAMVKVYLDNPGVFSIENEKPQEIVIERVTKRDGTSIYRINGKTKTRNEVLELLAMANLNPYGFNIIRQQEIFKFVDMKPEDRRKLVEEISGISIYENRKEKALKELEKTEEKLREVKTILNEKQSLLSNLEKEKRQAMLYNKLKNLIEVLKYSIIYKKREIKQKEKEEEIKKHKSLEEGKVQKEEKINKILQQLEDCKKEVERIDMFIEEITGIKQVSLQNEIMDLKTQIAKLEVKKNSLENNINSLNEKIKSLELEAISLEKEIERLKEERERNLKIGEKDKLNAIEQRIKEGKQRLSYLEKRKEKMENDEKRLFLLKEKLSMLNKEYLSINEKIDRLKILIFENNSRIVDVDKDIEKKIRQAIKEIESINEIINKNIKEISKKEKEIEIIDKEIEEINSSDVCPKCKRKLDEDFKKQLINELAKKAEGLGKEIKKILSEIKNLEKEKGDREKFLEKLKQEERKIYENKILEERIKEMKAELNSLLAKKKDMEDQQVLITKEIEKIEREIALENVEEKIIKLRQEINSLIIEKERMKSTININVNLDFEISIKERDLDNVRSVLVRSEKEREKNTEQLKNLNAELYELNKLLEQKQEKMNEIQKKFSDLINKKNELHKEILNKETEIANLRNEIIKIQEKMNEIITNIAKIDAEINMLDEEEKEIKVKDRIMKGPIFKLEEKLNKAKIKLEELGNINLLAIEAYEKIRKEVEEIMEKTKKIEEEKQEIIKQIEKIDKEKRKVFINTFEKINKDFRDNFSKLSGKGIAQLVLENPKQPFEGGIDIVLQFGKGKYFDSFSLSGGEKVLVALAFIFAIQNISPYYFYIFDEIDAALDKRNSERFAELLKKHIGKNQCIIITHNDATIQKADIIYGVSMQDGISKVLSLKV
jgi:chromosome segregation protein